MFIPIGDNVDRKTIPIIPLVLILANVFVFSYQVRLSLTESRPQYVQEKFYDTWGLVPEELANGNAIGLVTHMFVHGGFMHIIGNMIVLWAFAGSLEIGLGKAYLALFYVLWGVAGGVLHAVMQWGSDVPLVGASGAIAGLIGAYTVAYGPMCKIKTLIFLGFHIVRVDIPATVYGMGWFAMQLLEASNDPHGISGVAWYCHIGGFAAGAVTMLCIRHNTKGYMVENRHGQLEFRTRDDGSESDEEVRELEVPETCQYCGTEVDEENLIADNLVRCTNPKCERLTYLEPKSREAVGS